ncbi:hypothetical protein DPMN_143275 [Dreissena polymorpha]|uniref:Uncharacterized protein n=1 Tax=Dreissena polymorpha TaxID=45954 RepID=A0A9D4GCV8_DREPO|nr:hypothetical protein DPMN_143275 [Dreissena polymorpha]
MVSVKRFYKSRVTTYIIETNLMTKIYQDQTIHVESRQHKTKYAPTSGLHVFQTTKTICQLILDIIGTNFLTKFHDDRTMHVALNKVYYSHIRKNAPSPGYHVFQPTQTMFKLVQDIIRMNLLTKFHEDRKINVSSRMFTTKGAPPPGGNVFQANETIKPVQDIIRTIFPTKFHDDWPINVASRENLGPLGGHFHDDWKINVASRVKNAPPLGGHFKLVQYIIRMNLVTKIHEDRTINVASRVLASHIMKHAPSLGSQSEHIIETNLSTKVAED